MLNKLTEQIRERLQHAEDCALKAAAHPEGSQTHQDFLEMEKLPHSQGLPASPQLCETFGEIVNFPYN